MTVFRRCTHASEGYRILNIQAETLSSGTTIGLRHPSPCALAGHLKVIIIASLFVARQKLRLRASIKFNRATESRTKPTVPFP